MSGALRAFGKIVRDDLALVHVDLLVADDLIILVALAAEQDDVARLMMVDRPADGLRAVADDLVGRFARAHEIAASALYTENCPGRFVFTRTSSPSSSAQKRTPLGARRISRAVSEALSLFAEKVYTGCGASFITVSVHGSSAFAAVFSHMGKSIALAFAYSSIVLWKSR